MCKFSLIFEGKLFVNYHHVHVLASTWDDNLEIKEDMQIILHDG